MPTTQFRGSTQIMDATIPVAKLVTGFLIPTANLTEGADFIKRTGTVAFTANTSMGNNQLTNVADAVGAQDAVNLRTAQGLINGVALKTARLVSIINQALTGLPTIDSVLMTAGQIVLLTAQTTTAQNGLWAVASGAWTRPLYWAAASAQKSTIFFVEEGTVYKDTKWIAITDAITVDTTAVTVTQDTSGTTYTNGSGLSLTGSTFAVKLGAGLNFDGSSNVAILTNGASLNNTASGIKITNGTGGQVMIANGTGDAIFQSVTGDVTVGATGVSAVNNVAGTGFLKYTGPVYNETPAGLVNSANTAFTIVTTPTNSSLKLFLNGMLLEPGAGNDYTITGATVTMLFAPATGDKLRAYYVK